MHKDTVLIADMSDKFSYLVKTSFRGEEVVTIFYDRNKLGYLTRTGRNVLETAIEAAQTVVGSTKYTTRLEIYRIEYRPSFKNWRVYMRRVQYFTADAITEGFPTQPQVLFIDFVIAGDNVRSVVGSESNYAK